MGRLVIVGCPLIEHADLMPLIFLLGGLITPELSCLAFELWETELGCEVFLHVRFKIIL